MKEYHPEYDKDGVGIHSDDCPAYDGKRCSLIGFRPDRICEAWVLDLIKRAGGKPCKACGGTGICNKCHGSGYK